MPLTGTAAIKAASIVNKLQVAGFITTPEQAADALDKWTKYCEADIEHTTLNAAVQVTIPIGLVTQGAGLAAAPNVAPLPILGIPGNPISVGGVS